MNILFYCPLKFSLTNSNNKSLGGIETLNIELCKILSNRKTNIFLASYCYKKNKKKGVINIPIKFLLNNYDKYKFDKIISSNDPTIFNYYKSSENFLWIHNKLQIEKSIRKGKFFSILRNKIFSIFVSKYLDNKTSQIYNFKKRFVIPNFLDPKFENLPFNKVRKPYFVWSVQRSKGLNEIIMQWKKSVYSKNNKLKLFIFGINKKSLITYNIKNLKKFNIFFKGRVNKKILINYYLNSMGMICLGYDETFCLNAIESFSCGLPIITFGHTAVSEISNKKNSILVSSFDEIPDQILKLNNMKTFARTKLINNCIKFSKNYYLKNLINIWYKSLSI